MDDWDNRHCLSSQTRVDIPTSQRQLFRWNIPGAYRRSVVLFGLLARKMIARIEKATPITLGTVCIAVAVGVPFLPGVDRAETGLWIVLGLFLLGGITFIWTAYRHTPELVITESRISIRGSHFDRSNIQSARIFWADYDGRGRFIEIHFKKMQRLTIGWKLAKFFEAFGFPKKCSLGIPLSEEPRIIAPLNATDLSDDELNSRLNRSELAVGGNRQERP